MEMPVSSLPEHRDKPPANQPFLADKPAWVWSILAVLVLAAIIIRIQNFERSTLIAERQYRSALIARVLYLRTQENEPDWRLKVAEASVNRKVTLEPPVLEFLVSRIYGWIGHEDLAVPRMINSILWLIGGLCLFHLVRRLVDTDAAVVSSAYFLFVPLGVHASISFIPDPLMIALFLASLLAITRYFEGPSISRLVLAATLSGAGILIKPLCMPALLAAFLASVAAVQGWRSLVSLHSLTYLSISVVAGCSYYLYGILFDDFLRPQAHMSFLPQLLLEKSYWLGWLKSAAQATGQAPLFAGLLGLPLLHSSLQRALAVGMGIGYVLFCLFFTYHIRFASYYHLQLIVIVALSAAPSVPLLRERLVRLTPRWPAAAAICGVALLGALFALVSIRDDFRESTKIDQPDTARQIGNIVSHSAKTVFVASYYGAPLEYYAEIAGDSWPRRNDQWMFLTDVQSISGGEPLSVRQRLSLLSFSPQYFIITAFAEYEKHHQDLQEYLEESCRLQAGNEKYLIYGACRQSSKHTAAR